MISLEALSPRVVKEPILQNKGQMNGILNKIGLYRRETKKRQHLQLA